MSKHFMKYILLSSLLTIIGGCGGGEPALPTSDPSIYAKKRQEGYQVGGNTAVDAKNQFYHMQHLVTGSHKIDVKTPPISITQVEPSCKVKKPAKGTRVHVIMSEGHGRAHSLTKAEQPTLLGISKTRFDLAAKVRAKRYVENGTTNSILGDNGLTSMRQKDIVVTESRHPVFIVLPARYPTLFNFSISPHATIEGVLIYSGDGQAATSGLPESTPVYFQAEKHDKTAKCWVRVQNKPDESWSDYKEAMRQKTPSAKKRSRYHLMVPYHKKFAAKVRRDAGVFSDDRLISIDGGRYFLIGPAPKLMEQRIPYSPVAGSNIKVLATEHLFFGSQEERKSMARKKLDEQAMALANGQMGAGQ